MSRVHSREEGALLLYTAQHIAARLGITPRQLRKFLRSIDVRTSGTRYEFTHREVAQICDRYLATHTHACGDHDTSPPGLPVAMLHDTSRQAREQFAALRRERLARLDRQVRVRGMSLGQLDENSLLVTGRIRQVYP